ncbi:MAG: DUF192 domain-containing protein [Rhodothermales bacterium]
MQSPSFNIKWFSRFPTYLFIFLLLALAGCTSDNGSDVIDEPNIEFRPDGVLEVIRTDGSVLTTLVIEIAAGDSARARGLMQRNSLPARGGMLFLDDEEKIQTFWMRNTPLPLDLIFVDADSQIVSISKRARPFTEQTISSADTALYVLEVNAGFTDRYGIDESMRISWRLKQN